MNVAAKGGLAIMNGLRPDLESDRDAFCIAFSDSDSESLNEHLHITTP